MAQLDAKYQRLQRQQTFANTQAKRTFDLRNTAAGALLKRTGAGSITEGTKKNYSDIAHAEAEKAAKEGAKAAISDKDASAIAKERVKQTYGNVEKEHEEAQQQVRDARLETQRAREDGAKAQQIAQEHERTAREAESRKEDLQRQHDDASTDAAAKARLKTQMDEEIQNIERARTQATRARTQANERTQQANAALQAAQAKVRDLKPLVSDFNAEVKKEVGAVKQENAKLVGAVAKGAVGNRFQQALYRSTGMGDQHMLHESEVAAQARAKIRDKAEEKKKLDEYGKDAHAPAPASGGDHH